MQEPWTSRRFAFDLPVERLAVLIDRLRGAPLRIAAAVRGLAPAVLARRVDDAWSIQEQVGHLHDLEALHLRRLDELERGATVLTAADMQNTATWQAGHNDRPFAEVFAAFAASRARLIARLEGWDLARLGVSALHPRLQQPMRVVDVAFFTAEHDDHHLARIHELVRATDAAPPPAVAVAWTELPVDQPMARLDRRRIVGQEAMLSHVTLRAGCVVPVHAHANEQFSCVLSGRVRFTLADGERTLVAGEVLHLPGHAPHGAEALADSVVLDVFAPPSATTGIDRT